MACIGIDLGTTHACVGVWYKNKINIIANDHGFRSTPCYVSFSNDEILVGDAALDKAHSNASNTIYHLKRIIGKRYQEIKTEKFFKDWTFHLKSCDTNKEPILAKIQDKGKDRDIRPEEFCSMVLSKLKTLAEDYTGESIHHCVITVPVHYTEEHRQCMTEAAKISGLNILRFINEPIAAAIAYNLDEIPNKGRNHDIEQLKNVIIFDLGGATHDITLLRTDKGLLQTLATVGDDSLGGDDFTNDLVEFCMKNFEKKNKTNIKNNDKAIHRLKLACETAKKSLSQQTQVTIEVDSLDNGKDFSIKLSRSRFEDLIYDHLRKAVQKLDDVLEKVQISKDMIDQVILVGGSTRIPKLQSLIEKFFDGKKCDITISPDEVIAYGATMQASILMDTLDFDLPSKNEQIETQVTPLTLGIEGADGTLHPIITRHTVLPAYGYEMFTTSKDNQKSVYIQVYEGERAFVKYNTLLATFCLDNIPKMKAECPEIKCEFFVNMNGQLIVKANEISTGIKKELTIKADNKRLTKEQVNQIIQDADDAAEEDEKLLDKLDNGEEINDENVSIEQESVDTSLDNITNDEMD